MVERPTNHAARLAFWEDIHHGRATDSVSWWQSVPELSLSLVELAGVTKDAAIIDVGAGSSTLVDHLLALGYRDLTAIDLSSSALDAMRRRLGPSASEVSLEVADVLELHLGRRFALWHDRAVFHFLVDATERDEYRASLHLDTTDRRITDRGNLRTERAHDVQRPADRALQPRRTRCGVRRRVRRGG